MTAQGVTTRLKRASQLRRLCLSLGRAKAVNQIESLLGEPTREEQLRLIEEIMQRLRQPEMRQP